MPAKRQALDLLTRDELDQLAQQHQNVHVEAIRDDLETLVLDESDLEIVLSTPDPRKKAKEVELKLTTRLRNHGGNPVFRALSERLEVVTDIDQIVRLVRFPGWQKSTAGEREVKGALRRTLLKYQLHQDKVLFEKAFGYVQQYY